MFSNKFLYEANELYFMLQRNVDGVITITYKEFEGADLCVKSLNQR